MVNEQVKQLAETWRELGLAAAELTLNGHQACAQARRLVGELQLARLLDWENDEDGPEPKIKAIVKEAGRPFFEKADMLRKQQEDVEEQIKRLVAEAAAATVDVADAYAEGVEQLAQAGD